VAVAFVRTHTGANNKTAGTTIDIGISTATTAGNLLVARVIFDNFTTASKPIVSSIAKPGGETASWVSLGAARSTSTSGGAFASGEMWCIQTTVSWPVATYNVTLDSSVTQKATHVQEFSGAKAVVRSTGGTNYSTTTTAASAATTGTTPVIGDLALGLIFGSNAAAAQAGDTDTTGGSWSAVAGFGTTGGNVATNNFGIAQYKILTGANAQTLNNSAAMTAGNGAIVAILQQYVEPSITQAAYRLYADGTETGSTALAAQNTSYTADVSSGDVNLQVRTLLQATAGDAGLATDDYKLQWEKNSSGSWTSVSSGSGALVDSYDSSNQSTVSNITSATSGKGQSFTGDGTFLAQAGFYMYKSSSPTGNMFAYIKQHTGTFGAGGLPGTVLATSSPVDISTLGTSLAWCYFTFDGSFNLAAGTNYFLTVEPESSATVNVTDQILLGLDNTSPTHPGNGANNASGTWSTSTSDYCFEVSTTPSTVIAYGSANLTDAAATTNRLTGGTGTFVAGKVSEDGLVDDLALTVPNFTELLYSVTLKQADLTNSDTLRFRVLRNAATTGLTYTQTPTINVTKTVPAITQAAYRFYADGTESGSTALAAQSTSYAADITSGDVNLQLRMLLQLTTGVAAPSTDDWQLQWEANASGTWTNVASTGVVGYDSASLTDGAATTNRLTGGTGSFVAGEVSETGLVTDLGWSGNNYTELLYSITLKQAGTIRFRVLRNGSTAELTYTSVPTIDVTATWPTANGRSGGATGASAVTSHPITLPAGITVGEMLYVYFANLPESTPTIDGSSATGWQMIFATGQSNSVRHYVFRKLVVDASNALTLTTASGQSSHISYRVGGAAGGAFFIKEVNNNGVANIDMAAAQTIYGFAEFPKPMLGINVRNYNDPLDIASAAPTGYLDLNTQASTGASPSCMDAAVKNFVGSIEDPGPWTHPGAVGYHTLTLITSPFTTDSTATISEDFSTLDTTTKWDTSNTTASAVIPTVSSGRLVLTSVTNVSQLAKLETRQMYNVTGGSICVELVDPGTVLTLNTIGVPLRLYSPSTAAAVETAVYFRLLGPTGNLLDCRYRGGGQAVLPANAGAVTFNATNHRWLRIRESGGFVYWDASTDGILWNNLASIDWSLIAGWDPAYVIPDFAMERTGAAESGTTSMLLDNVNLSPAVTLPPRNTRMTNAATVQSFTR
jgi:hypothetical protein